MLFSQLRGGLELLRVYPLGMALIRKCVGPNATERERETTYLCFRPLSDPEPFRHAEVFSEVILYFMVCFVYVTTAPLTSYFLCGSFLILGFVYRHQFIYNYPITDSGGKLWTGFIGIALSCMLIAQITLAGLLILKKAKYATPALVPLMIITILFNFWLHKKHFLVTKHLPTRECLRLDKNNHKQGYRDFRFLQGKYLQPALHEKYVFPDSWRGAIPHDDEYSYPAR
jgi:hypothetical protein